MIWLVAQIALIGRVGWDEMGRREAASGGGWTLLFNLAGPVQFGSIVREMGALSMIMDLVIMMLAASLLEATV
jgi:hypothetical protein